MVTPDLQSRLQAALGDAFRIERELTGGGMSRLFVALELSLHRRVVIKLLPPELASEVSAARFKQEMEFAAGLQHPHILPVLSAGVRGDLLFYVMPFAEGESLRARITREGTLPLEDAYQLLREIADALAYAHGQGIIHRDIKPENILLEGRHAVLADFGIARAFSDPGAEARLTASGMSIGTPGYMAPEQLAGGDVDARADVYALAVVAYEMVAGRPPFAASTAQALITAHLTEPPRPLREIRPETPHALSAAIARALSKSPSDRFASAGAFADAIARLDDTEAQDPDERARGRRTLLRWAAAVAGLATLAVFALTRINATSRIQAAVGAALDAGDLDQVAYLLDSLHVGAGSRRLGALRERITGTLALTGGDGLVVTAYRVQFPAELAGRGIPLGAPPVAATALVAGEYLLVATRGPGDTLRTLVSVAVGSGTTRALPPPHEGAEGFVLVDPVSGAAGTRALIGRCEVSNAEYLAFVRAGGYQDATQWQTEMRVRGREVEPSAAATVFVDRTGLAGPREWVNGRHADGAESHPVTGVSWYEAMAYARWAGGTLPTHEEWRRAALGSKRDPFPWGGDGLTADLRANFGSNGTTSCGSYPLGSTPFGAQDMAGNVREWVVDADAAGRQRLVVGGGWQDPSYVFSYPNGQTVAPDEADRVTGFRIQKRLPQ